MIPQTVILMGVCGCGKTRIGEILARETGGVFEDADDFHTDAAKDKMRASMPLTDDDRWPWFDRLRARIDEMRGLTPHYVLACSALKQIYRDRLRGSDTLEQLRFVFLDGSFELIESRMARRKGHYMPLSLLHSQFAILERPVDADAITVSIEPTPKKIAADILAKLGR
jgi:gluconokinase